MNVMFSSRSGRWGTPEVILDAVRLTLGSIDLDPASEEFFNKNVRASRYISELSLESPWLDFPGNIFINPPGGKTNGKSTQKLFWQRLMDEVDLGKVGHAIFMAFSVEALQSTQSCTRAMLDYPMCVPKKRVRFVPRTGSADSPSHSNVIVYVPGAVDKTELFYSAFSQIGKCK